MLAPDEEYIVKGGIAMEGTVVDACLRKQRP